MNNNPNNLFEEPEESLKVLLTSGDLRFFHYTANVCTKRPQAMFTYDSSSMY